MALIFPNKNVPTRTAPPVEPTVSWTESLMAVEEVSLFPEKSETGKPAFSVRMELAEEPESSSNTRNRTVIQLVFGLEEKDVPTIARLLGRQVYLNQKRSVELIEKEQLTVQLKACQEYIASLERKVEYLNNSIHHYVQESRKFNQ